MDLLIDLRALQDPDYAPRGIGRHGLALLRGAPRARWRIVGLVDPAMPPLADAARDLVDALRETAYTGAMRRPAGFVSPSPMTHDPLFTARLLDHKAIPSAAVVLDFIPFDAPDRHLPDPPARLDYAVAMRWLRRYDLFLPISDATADRLRALLGIAEAQIVVTGAAVEPGFGGRVGSGSATHLLLVGGDDPRKNAATAVRAHAAARAVQHARIPLVIIGQGMDGAAAAGLRAIAGAAGGDPDLLRCPGTVSDAALRALYRDALALVAPSLDEGFSLPVAEAMASGIPVLASDIPAHRALVPDPARRFPPTDAAALAALLDRAPTEDRAAILAAQDAIWPHYRADRVAARFWDAVEIRFGTPAIAPGATPALLRGARPRLALLAPLPPAPTGIADYTASGCAALGRLVDLTLFTPTPDPTPIPDATIAPLSVMPHLAAEFDRVVAVIGNNPDFHASIAQSLLRFGGACIAHDATMRDCLPADGAPALDADAARLGPFAARAEPLFVHAAALADAIRARHGVTAIHLPFALQRNFTDAVLTPPARAAARARLGLADDATLIASFGFITASKAPAIAIRALALLRDQGVAARLAFVGATQMDLAPLHDLALDLGVADIVSPGDDFVSPRAYRDWLLAADLGLQLREDAIGAVSGTLSDCIAAGMPAVASTGLAEAIEAPGYVVRVPDPPDASDVAAALAGLLALGRHRIRIAPERRAYAAARGFDRYAARLCAGLGLG